MSTIITRRSMLRSLFVAAPAVVMTAKLMPIRGIIMPAELTNQIWKFQLNVGYDLYISDILRKQVQPLTMMRIGSAN
jgi:hypothetical protein